MKKKKKYLENDLRNFNEIFLKSLTFDNMKVTKIGVSPSLKKIQFWKNHSVDRIDPPASLGLTYK